MTFFLNTYCEPDFSRMILYRLSHVIQITFNPLRPDFIVITLKKSQMKPSKFIKLVN